jgi:hypothetical protein
MSDKSDDDSFSSDSDDEFLTMRQDGQSNVDREALIRKKLLESFYGKSAVPSEDSDDDDDSKDEDDDDIHAASQLQDPSAQNDLDSPHFQAAPHTARHVLQSNVHDLLETEEHLALQVRTLDSSMQTLVYENYSRFIDATDAIRSIGVHVGNNKKGLATLNQNMETISEASREIETAVGTLRDSVVEKLRVKRLLTRLDTLLKLPQTLQDQISQKKYRLATKSYLSAYSILSKHSAGFESLQRIETECHVILTNMLTDLRRKLLHWSGRLVDDDLAPPDPPRTVAEILECAGTPILLLSKTTDTSSHGEMQLRVQDDAAADPVSTEAASTLAQFDPGLTEEQCQEMALSASLRFLERVSDTHHLELQEAKFQAISNNDSVADHAKLIPTHVLDSILEASTLFGMSFGTKDESSQRLAQFVLDAFSAFLYHVRGEFLEQSLQAQSSSKEEQEGEEHEHSSTAMTLLLQAVRQLASGLALPEVGINPDLASNLVDQTVGLTEAMVRRRVDQKFYTLRFRVIQDCLAPFCTNAMQQEEEEADATGTGSSSRILHVVQMASVALSDSLQLVDDTVRSILSEDAEASTDASMLKQAVETSTKRFAIWLASAMEILAGCESSDPKLVIEVMAGAPEDGLEDTPKEGNSGGGFGPSTSIASPVSMGDDASEISEDPQDPTQLVDNALLKLLEELETSGSKTARSDMTLAIAEMCRVAERSVLENISQSIAAHGGGSKQRKSKGLFPSDGTGPQAKTDSTSSPTAERFRLAASRALGLFAMNRGSDAADLLCIGLSELAQEDVAVHGPRAAAWQVLEVVKLTSYDCANLFGGPKRAGPVPYNLEDEMQSYTRQAARSGLIFDVERMFAEKVVVYPHPSEFADFTRNSVLTIVMKVAFKAMVEYSRTLRFSSDGFRQLMVDVEFFKFMIPHYVKDEFLSEGSNARAVLLKLLTDTASTGREGCTDKSVNNAEKEVVINEARAVIRVFMAAQDGTDGIVQRFTISED